MKKIVLSGMALWVAAWVGAEEVPKITVTGNRVSLRAAPQINAVLLDRAALNEQLVLANDSNPEWVGVRPPERIDLWVHSDYIEGDKVLPERLNIRSGPSRSHEIVGVVLCGNELTVRGQLDGWVRIAPPAGTIVWISRKYTTVPARAVKQLSALGEPVLITLDPEIPAIPVQPADSSARLITLNTNEVFVVQEPRILITVEPSTPAPAEVVAPRSAPAERAKKEIETIVKSVLQPVINDVLAAVATIPDVPDVLLEDPEKEQGHEGKCSGRLRPENALLYKVVDPENEQIVICYVRGDLTQMEAFSGRRLLLSGKTYWAAGLKPPMLVPETIELFSTPSAE